MSGWESRPPSEIQMGNGTLLATFARTGEIDQLYAPHIDALQSRVGAFRTSVLIPGNREQGAIPEMMRLTPEHFHIEVEMAKGSHVLKVEYQHRSRPLKLMRMLGLHPRDPIILDRWKVQNEPAGLIHESIPWMGHTTSAHCSLFHPTFNGLVHHRGRRWLGIILRSPTQWVRVGHLSEQDRYRLWSGEVIYAPFGVNDLGGYPAGVVRLGWDQVVQGPATWGAIAVGPADEHLFQIICAESENHLGHLMDEMNHVPVQRYFQISDQMVKRRHSPADDLIARISSGRVRSLAERSIDVLHALQDGKTGALMAAAEVDPHSRMCGGYGFSWPRDGAYLAMALDSFGFRTQVEHYFDFLKKTQDVSGAWWQRYLATGHAGPSWGRIQIDEPATAIGAAFMHFQRTQDLLWLQEFWPSIERGLGFLEAFHAPDHPLGLPSHDLWEERMGIHAYSIGACAYAFLAGGQLAGELSDTRAKAHYLEIGNRLVKELREKFVPAEGPLRRSFVVNGQGPEGGYWDEACDVSLLGLIVPFGILGKEDPAAQRILENVRIRLWNQAAAGGIMRYEGDTYRGGHPWILTTLWVAMVELQFGNYDQAKFYFQWALSKSTHLGMLPEQAHKETGHPHWVIPLAWSHGMFMVFCRMVLDLNAEDHIWGDI